MHTRREALPSAAVAAVALGATTLLVAHPPAHPALSAGALVRWADHTPFDQALGTLAAGGAWLCLVWLCAATSLAALAPLPGRLGHLADGLATRVTPRLLRMAVEGALGALAAVGTVAPATPALAQPPPATASARPADPARPSTAPSLDWPVRPSVPGATAGLVSAVRPSGTVDGTVVVRRGDSLWEIAARRLGPHASDAEVAAAWPRWYAANRAVIGADPDLLLPGQRLVPPH